MSGPTFPASPIKPLSSSPLPPLMPTAHRDPGELRTLVVGRGISVQGSVQDAERLVVEGAVESKLIHANHLSISPGGVFTGGAKVDEADIAGTIVGTLTVRNALIIRATGRVQGTARCRRLQVEDVGQINSQVEMITQPDHPETMPRPLVGPV